MCGLKLDRDFYKPSYAELVPVDVGGFNAEVYKYDFAGNLYAIGFYGKRAKPSFHYRYGSEKSRDEAIQRYIDGWNATVEYKQKLRDERKSAHTLKEGDILYSSWGYEQTNIDFYQVTRVISDKMVEIRQIASDMPKGETGFMSGMVVAIKDKFVGDPMRKRANATNYVRIASYAGAGKWDGKPLRCSWYA